MRLGARLSLCVWMSLATEPLVAQLPFYTDDPAVTERWTWHLECFNEHGLLQLQYPNLKQNTANYNLNFGPPHSLELNVDVPYLALSSGALGGKYVASPRTGVQIGLTMDLPGIYRKPPAIAHLLTNF